jgi:diaminopimelate epimerase
LIRFVKAHACGNDFLILDAAEVSGEQQRDCAVQLCARNTGIGADGVEYLEWTGKRSGTIRLFNADGSIAEISGNGTRCVAAWIAHEKGLGPGDSVSLQTDAGLRDCSIQHADGSRFQIASLMGIPKIDPRTVVLADGTIVEGVAVFIGNPHFVIFVEDVAFTVHTRSWQDVGREICFHSDFPEQTNVEFVRVVSTSEIEIRIFERGVGPTTSSGTGTCATAVATMFHRGATHLLVQAPGGEQSVEWLGGEAEIRLTGPAELIATGETFGC